VVTRGVLVVYLCVGRLIEQEALGLPAVRWAKPVHTWHLGCAKTQLSLGLEAAEPKIDLGLASGGPK
jgi:hypothetical protein